MESLESNLKTDQESKFNNFSPTPSHHIRIYPTVLLRIFACLFVCLI